MACQLWSEKLGQYVDGELPPNEQHILREHMRGCADCSSESLDQLRAKRAIQLAGQRFVPDAAFRARIQAGIQKKTSASRPAISGWRWLANLATSAVAALLLFGALFLARDRSREQHLIGELADLHVATLASASPVDVVSTDRHTVKPWFEGKIPFTFNLPELGNTGFVLVGGRVSYLNQAPGAELIFRVRQHQISVFIFQERAVEGMGTSEAVSTELSFGVRSWSRNGLRYFVIGDANAEDLNKLSELLKSA
jgi:anti-sigma factor RsiW